MYENIVAYLLRKNDQLTNEEVDEFIGMLAAECDLPNIKNTGEKEQPNGKTSSAIKELLEIESQHDLLKDRKEEIHPRGGKTCPKTRQSQANDEEQANTHNSAPTSFKEIFGGIPSSSSNAIQSEDKLDIQDGAFLFDIGPLGEFQVDGPEVEFNIEADLRE